MGNKNSCRNQSHMDQQMPKKSRRSAETRNQPSLDMPDSGPPHLIEDSNQSQSTQDERASLVLAHPKNLLANSEKLKQSEERTEGKPKLKRAKSEQVTDSEMQKIIEQSGEGVSQRRTDQRTTTLLFDDIQNCMYQSSSVIDRSSNIDE